MKTRLFGVLLAATGIAACVTPAQTFQYDNSRDVTASYDTTWERTITVLASNNLPIKTLEKDSGIVVAENELVSVASMGESVSCPSSMLATPIGGVMNYNILVRKTGEETSNVTINTRYQMTYRDTNGAVTTQV